MSAPLLVLFAIGFAPPAAPLEAIEVAPQGRSFVMRPSGRAFVPWGFNYPAGDRFHQEDWYPADKLEGDFQEMKRLGANLVRVHLEVAYYLDDPGRPSRRGLEQLDRLLAVAEKTGLYLDVTGLACYRPQDAMPWYDNLDESRRWAVQERFWTTVAERCAPSRAVFCYDLMNEPVVAAQPRPAAKWYSGHLFGGCDFVQYINLDPAGRPRHEIATAWIRRLSAAIRGRDPRRLITVGLLPSTPAWGHFSGFPPDKIAPDLDFIAVHVYPEKGRVEQALATTRGFAVGKPLLIEETYALTCSTAELKDYVLASSEVACGWIGHYGGERLEELEARVRAGRADVRQALVCDWLKFFREMSEQVQAPRKAPSRPASSPAG
ncbi:MAG: cellulase family glycosylhydrolase [Phycisphaerae bacterium]|jgi:hypothetical protein